MISNDNELWWYTKTFYVNELSFLQQASESGRFTDRSKEVENHFLLSCYRAGTMDNTYFE